MIFPFVDDLDNDREISSLRYLGSKQFPGSKHQTPIIKFESKFNKCIFKVFCLPYRSSGAFTEMILVVELLAELLWLRREQEHPLDFTYPIEPSKFDTTRL